MRPACFWRTNRNSTVPDYGTLQLEEEQLRLAYEREEPYVDAARGFSYGPVRLGMKSIGSFGISGAPLTRQTLEAVGDVAGDRDRTSARRRTTEPHRSRPPERTAEIGAAGFHYP